MGLDQQLADFKAEFLRTAPAGRPALYEAKIEELRAGFALEAAVGVEARAPDFRLPDVRGNPVSDVIENDSAVPGDYICRGYRQLPTLVAVDSRQCLVIRSQGGAQLIR